MDGKSTTFMTRVVKDMYGAVSTFYAEKYRYLHPGKRSANQIRSSFVRSFFDSQSEYEKYTSEFDQGPIAEIRAEALQQYEQLISSNVETGIISEDDARNYYAITRKLKPTKIIETGVCNGLSTLSILLALRKNGRGHLYSIDYPFRADESLSEFRDDTFQGYGGAAIPANKDPGWIIPTELKNRWTLIIGKSQRELPKLVSRLGEFDLFIHDSEHSHPCMMFEFELAYEWLDDNGVIVSDDITWNEAFEIFVHSREVNHGRISRNVGFVQKL